MSLRIKKATNSYFLTVGTLLETNNLRVYLSFDLELHQDKGSQNCSKSVCYSVLYKCASGADPGFDQGGGPDRDRPKLLTVRSSVVRVKRALFSMGSRAHLRAPEALGYFITKYAFSPFWGTFLYYS